MELGRAGWKTALGAPGEDALRPPRARDDCARTGCGTGYFTQQLARSGADIIGVDISPELLEIAKARCSASNVRYERQNACAFSYLDAMFDSVVGSSVLHHLEIKEAVREIYRVLKSHGTMSFTEPNMLNPQIAIQKNVPWVKRKLGDSPDETAFFRWPLRRLLEAQASVMYESTRLISYTLNSFDPGRLLERAWPLY